MSSWSEVSFQNSKEFGDIHSSPANFNSWHISVCQWACKAWVAQKRPLWCAFSHKDPGLLVSTRNRILTEDREQGRCSGVSCNLLHSAVVSHLKYTNEEALRQFCTPITQAHLQCAEEERGGEGANQNSCCISNSANAQKEAALLGTVLYYKLEDEPRI